MTQKTSQLGMTLLEVLVALFILAIALLGFTQGQSALTRTTIRTERLSQAANLAQQKMTETELLLQKRGLQSLLEEEKGEFKDDKLKDFKWTRKLEKVNLNCFLPNQNEEEGSENADKGFFGLAEKIFEQAIRKIVITVEWNEGKKTRKVDLTQLYVRFQDIPRFGK